MQMNRQLHHVVKTSRVLSVRRMMDAILASGQDPNKLDKLRDFYCEVVVVAIAVAHDSNSQAECLL